MNILLYAPDLTGHPQVYCRVITDILLELGCRVVLAVGRTQPLDLSQWPDLGSLINRDGVTFENCANDEGLYLDVESLRDIQKRYQIDSSLFIEGDKFRDQFYRIGLGQSPKLKGRNYAIFARTASWYPGEDFYSGARVPLWAPTIRGNLGKWKRFFLHRRESDRYFFENLLLRNRILDGVLVKDERVAEHFGPPVYWMPEIFRPFVSIESDVDKEEFDRISSEYLQFEERNSGGTPVLFFGTGSWYRGYDFFLKLLQMDSGSYGIHGGGEYVREQGKEYLFDVVALRKTLRKEGRLFETNGYVRSQKLIDFFFGRITHGVSTHRLTASSGTVLQTLWAGKPVLVPVSGLLGYQNSKYGLGPTYTYGNMESLQHNWTEFKKVRQDVYSVKIKAFIERFSRENMVKFYSGLLMQTK